MKYLSIVLVSVLGMFLGSDAAKPKEYEQPKETSDYENYYPKDIEFPGADAFPGDYNESPKGTPNDDYGNRKQFEINADAKLKLGPNWYGKQRYPFYPRPYETAQFDTDYQPQQSDKDYQQYDTYNAEPEEPTKYQSKPETYYAEPEEPTKYQSQPETYYAEPEEPIKYKSQPETYKPKKGDSHEETLESIKLKFGGRLNINNILTTFLHDSRVAELLEQLKLNKNNPDIVKHFVNLLSELLGGLVGTLLKILGLGGGYGYNSLLNPIISTLTHLISSPKDLLSEVTGLLGGVLNFPLHLTGAVSGTGQGATNALGDLLNVATGTLDNTLKSVTAVGGYNKEKNGLGDLLNVATGPLGGLGGLAGNLL